MNTLNLVGLVLASSVFAFLLSSFVEWFLHAKILHEGENERHKLHHEVHMTPYFQNAHMNQSYGVAPAFFAGSTALMAIVGLMLGLLVSHPILEALVFGLTATVYFKLLEIVHRRVHEPKPGGWFERTALYRHLTKHHQVHHVRDDRNFCIVLPEFADGICGTLNGHMRSAKK